MRYEKLKLYQYILRFDQQFENIIILIIVLFSCTCNHFGKTWTIFLYIYISKKCILMHIKTCGSSILCNEVKEFLIDHCNKIYSCIQYYLGESIVKYTQKVV
jgi:hypothetical protein